MVDEPSPTQVPSSDQQFLFIAQSGSDTRTDTETLRRVHSHAQARFRRRVPYQRRQTTVELDLTALSQVSIGGTQGEPTGVPNPTTTLGAGRSDPFDSYALQGGRRAHRLWDHGTSTARVSVAEVNLE